MFSSVAEVSPMTALRQRMLEDLRIRNYAPTTVACYIRSVAEFAQHFNKPPDQLGPEEIRAWQLFLLQEKRVKLSTYIQAVCALRFFYQNTLHRRIEIDRIPLPRYEKKLPVILSKAEEPQTPGHARHDVRRGTPRIGSGQPEDVRSRPRTARDLGPGRQRSQRQTSHAGGTAPRLAGRVLALEAAHQLALPRQEPRF